MAYPADQFQRYVTSTEYIRINITSIQHLDAVPRFKPKKIITKKEKIRY